MNSIGRQIINIQAKKELGLLMQTVTTQLSLVLGDHF
jgi:hypothetical protein